MKKITAIVAMAIAACAVFALTACGGNKNEEPEAPQYASALELFNAIWDSYDAEQKFPAMGGSVTAYKDDAPSAFDVSGNKEEFLTMTHLTDDMLGAIGADVATLTHLMNGNTFTAVVASTGGVYAKTFAESYIAQLQDTQWMCGFPDKAVVILAGNYVVFAYGENVDNGTIDYFKSIVLSLDSDFTVLAEDNL